MKLLFFDDYRMGVLRGDRVVDVTSELQHVGIRPPEYLMEEVIADFDSFRPRFEAIASREQGVPMSGVRIRPPLPRPHNILAAFSNYQDKDEANVLPPDFFYKGATGIIGHGDTIEIPNIPEALVHHPEPELGYVIGREGKHVSEDDALDMVFGYLNFIDVSNRGIPNRRTTFMGKGMDTYAPIGPVIVTKDEVADPQDMRVRLWLNGELEQDYNTGEMNHSVRAQIAWLTQYITLMPGDVVCCGTHHIGLSPVNDGDRVDVEVEGLERLSLNVRSHGPRKDAHWRPPGTRTA